MNLNSEKCEAVAMDGKPIIVFKNDEVMQYAEQANYVGGTSDKHTKPQT